MGVIGPIDLDVDITGKVDIDGPLHTQVTVHLPDPSTITSPPVVIFAFPGGGASRAMWCMEAPTTLAYSQARWHAERGIVFVSCDHLGTGGSSHPDPALLATPHPLARANQATVDAVLGLLERGDLDAGFPAVRDPFMIGMGHSMGANLTIVLQAHREVFDAVAILGYSGIHTVLPALPGDDLRPPRRSPRLHPPDGRDISAERVSNETRRHMNRWDAAEAAAVKSHEWRLPLASKTMPPAAGFMNGAGVVAEEASWIEVPVFLGFGERDVTRDPWEEPRWFWRSGDVTLAVIPRMSHGMNSAETRALMWERIHHWAVGVAGRREAS